MYAIAYASIVVLTPNKELSKVTSATKNINKSMNSSRLGIHLKMFYSLKYEMNVC